MTSAANAPITEKICVATVKRLKATTAAVISSCNLDFDKVYEYGCLYSVVENNIIKKDMLRFVCGDCQWFHICGIARV